MVELRREHYEWAVVNRLKMLLETSSHAPLDVTQTFAFLTSIVLWSKNRAWVAGTKNTLPPDASAADRSAHAVRGELSGLKITSEPWSLSRNSPRYSSGRGELPISRPINFDFDEMDAATFFKWFRDALAHGDGRTTCPINAWSDHDRYEILVGFTISFEQAKGSTRILTLSLYKDDMIRLGKALADHFCRALSGENKYFEKDAATAKVFKLNSAA